MKSHLGLTAEERSTLVSLSRSRVAPAAAVKRARLIMMLDEGLSWNTISERLPCAPDYISRWKGRFESERLGGLYARHRGSEPAEETAKFEARVLAETQTTPSDGSTHWSTRKLGKALGVSHMMVARIWAKHGLKPHRLEHHMASNDPHLEVKAVDIIGLYMNPSAHAAAFCVDEKTAIRASERLDPVLPLPLGRLERHGLEDIQHGTLSLYAAFNTKTGQVLGKTAVRYTGTEFVAFLADICAHQPKRNEIHVICDNLSTRRTRSVTELLGAHPNVHLHYAPSYSSWLDQVGLWFARIERDVIARGAPTSVTDLKRRLMRYIRHYIRTLQPVKWVYGHPVPRTTTDSRVT